MKNEADAASLGRRVVWVWTDQMPDVVSKHRMDVLALLGRKADVVLWSHKGVVVLSHRMNFAVSMRQTAVCFF